MELQWEKENTSNIWWSTNYDGNFAFLGLYALNNQWFLYIGSPYIERFPIAEVTDLSQPPFEYAEQLWGLYCG